MNAEVGEYPCGAKGPLAIPDADVVDVGSHNEQQAQRKRLIPVSGRPELVVRDDGEAGRGFPTAKEAGGVVRVGRVEDGGKGLMVALCGAVDAEGGGGVMRRLPVGTGGITPEAGAVLLVGSAVGAVLVKPVHACEEAQGLQIVLKQDHAVLRMNAGDRIDRTTLPGS